MTNVPGALKCRIIMMLGGTGDGISTLLLYRLNGTYVVMLLSSITSRQGLIWPAKTYKIHSAFGR